LRDVDGAGVPTFVAALNASTMMVVTVTGVTGVRSVGDSVDAAVVGVVTGCSAEYVGWVWDCDPC
jgi:hypothetical protein